MAYHQMNAFFAPLPSGVLPSEKEVSALVRRGRKLQARSIWDKVNRVFHFGKSKDRGKLGARTGPSQEHRVPAPLLWAMLDRLNFNTARLRRDDFQSTIVAMTKHCHACTKSYRCLRWFHDIEPTDDPRAFCPNAAEFGSLPRAEPWDYGEIDSVNPTAPQHRPV
ncbi:MAG: hypothetical protein HOJ06_00250 [Rhodospirillaceae bacterium]|mgnify:CR=1|nr:hypothetical protein [Rhodospirillaceae bacterium]MBT5809459.1 hypothetical protein [Rhodospirillaceae bacterium]